MKLAVIFYVLAFVSLWVGVVSLKFQLDQLRDRITALEIRESAKVGRATTWTKRTWKR